MSSYAASTPGSSRKPVTLTRLREMHANGEPIAMLTAYDASFARLLDASGVDCVLVGDSLGTVIQGERWTLPVTLADVAYHTRCVARGLDAAYLIADMPYATFQVSPQAAFENAAHLMQAGAQMVKVEGGAWLAPTIEFLVERGVPVCAHLGLTPQSVHALGGYRIQGKSEESAAQLLRDAEAVATAGAAMLVLELIPAALAGQISARLPIPTIGIGAGRDCGGQVLVLYDMLDVFPGKKPRFVRNFMLGQASIGDAISAYVHAVKDRTFPGAEHAH